MIPFFCYPLLTIALGLAAWRLFRGPTAADRILAIDLLAVITASAALLHGIESGEPVFLDVVVVLGVIVFFGTVALARTLLRIP
jgi:multisubunit Na+/H+ antiporter MnhF subunit